LTYIGQQPATTFDSGIQDRFTGLTTNTVTLTHEISAEEDILVVWNNIVQDKNTYSVGGTGNKTVTLGGTLVSADVVTVYYTNKVMQSINPTANSVGITELNLSDGSNGQAITTNGSGTLAFSSVGADADNYFATSGLSSKDLGVGLHIKTGDSGGSVHADTDELVIEGASGHVGMTFLSTGGNKQTINFGDDADNNIGQIEYNHGENQFKFVTNTNSRLTIADDGAVAISKRLIIGDDGDSSYGLNIVRGGNAGENGVYFNDKDGQTSYEFFTFRRQGTQIGHIRRNGTNDSINYTTSSDYRLKDGIVDKTDGIEKLKQLKPKKFYWKSNADKTLVDGFLAHEVSDIVPEAISGTKDDVDENDKIIPQGIDQSKLVPLLTSALQEAITKIETLETEMTSLKARVKTLEDA
tara:strand:+ start:1132 stop:2364 length:1233 start_codon:yes stop_codon:yes gene_type:complete